MTGAQLRKLIGTAGLSQSEAARRLDIADRTIRRYIAGDLPVPRVIEFAIQYVAMEATKLNSSQKNAKVKHKL